MDGFPSLSQERSGWFPLSDSGEEWMVPPLSGRGVDGFPSLTQERSEWFPLSDQGEERMIPLTDSGEELMVLPI